MKRPSWQFILSTLMIVGLAGFSIAMGSPWWFVLPLAFAIWLIPFLIEKYPLKSADLPVPEPSQLQSGYDVRFFRRP